MQSPSPSRFARLAWIAYGLVSFVVFLVLTFPTELLLQRVMDAVEQTASLQIRYKTQRWTWSRGWMLEDISIEKTNAVSVQLTHLTLRPSVFGLFYGQPFPLTFSARLYDGAAHGTFRQAGNTFAVQLTIDQFSLAQWPFPEPWGHGKVSGNLTLDGALQGAGMDINTWSGSLSATLTEGSIKAGSVAKFPMPALQTVQARTQATLKDGRLEVSDLTLEADGISAQLQGAISLRQPLAWSALDLRLATRTTGAPPPPLATLVSLLPAVPGATGERRATITGTFAAPVMK